MMYNKYYTKEYLKEYINKLEGRNELNQIYNIKDENTPFILQYLQLIEYLKFRTELNNYILKWDIQNQNCTQINFNFENQFKPIEDKFCLIDKNWINKWRKHVGYDEIKTILKNQNININDIKPQEWILNIIEKNSKELLLSPHDARPFPWLS